MGARIFSFFWKLGLPLPLFPFFHFQGVTYSLGGGNLFFFKKGLKRGCPWLGGIKNGENPFRVELGRDISNFFEEFPR